MERLIIYDADKFDASHFYELAGDYQQLVIGERPHPLNTATADETATIAVVSAASQVNKRTLIRLPVLRLLVTLSDDTSHINLRECATRGITVCNLPGATSLADAEYTMMLMLTLSRNLPRAVDGLRQANTSSNDSTGFDLAGKTLLIIGGGHTARKVAGLARAFAIRPLVTDPFADSTSLAPDLEYTGLHDGLKRADLLSLHTPFTPETHHIINQRSLAITKPGLLVINTAHGSLINTTALLHSLHTERIAGAALDAIEQDNSLPGPIETLVQDDGSVTHEIQRSAEHEALLKLPNVILTHRHAANTQESRRRLGQGGLAVVSAFLNNTPVNIVPLTA